MIQCRFGDGELLTADLALIHALGHEFSDQAVGVLVASALRLTVRVWEVDVDVGC